MQTERERERGRKPTRRRRRRHVNYATDKSPGTCAEAKNAFTLGGPRTQKDSAITELVPSAGGGNAGWGYIKVALKLQLH
jgi:hypothetical protein